MLGISKDLQYILNYYSLHFQMNEGVDVKTIYFLDENRSNKAGINIFDFDKKIYGYTPKIELHNIDLYNLLIICLTS